MSEYPKYGRDGTTSFQTELPNTVYDRVGEIAGRLGVKPCFPKPDRPPTVFIATSEGIQYDVYELIIAFLDKVDSAAS